MTPERFNACLEILGLTMRKLAKILGTHNTSVQRWANGKQEIPKNLEDWLEKLVKDRLENPLPNGWAASRTIRYPKIQ